jgi:hypothetical protein
VRRSLRRSSLVERAVGTAAVAPPPADTRLLSLPPIQVAIPVEISNRIDESLGRLVGTLEEMSAQYADMQRELVSQRSRVLKPVPAVLSTVEAGEYLAGTSPHTLERWRCHGSGPPWIRFEGKVCYRRVDLDAYLEAHLVEPSDGPAAKKARA